MTEEKLPAKREYSEVAVERAFVQSPAVALWFDDRLFDKAKQIATYLAGAEGFVPAHLVGKPMVCFAVVAKALLWKLDPYFVASCMYQTPGGKVGFEGKLCQAALENSGRIEGNVKFEHFGDWNKVKGKWKVARSQKGHEYPERLWTYDDAKGLGVVVSAKVKGEAEPRTWTLNLDQCFPLNSTQWALDPHSQICSTAVRRFANFAAPGLFAGVDFDRENVVDADYEVVRAARAEGIAPPPPPTREEKGEPTAETNPQSVVTETAGPTATADPPSQEEEAASPAESSSSGTPSETARTGSNVVEGGKSFTIFDDKDEELFTTDDPEEFVKLLASEAARFAGNKPILSELWKNNKSQFSHLPKKVYEALRAGWPKDKKPDESQGGLGV